MSMCQSCGGVIGRDCFNPQECMEITRQQAVAFESQGDIRGELEYLRARVKELEDLMWKIRGDGTSSPTTVLSNAIRSFQIRTLGREDGSGIDERGQE